MKKNHSISSGVLISRYDKDIQYPARRFLEEQWGAERIDLLTAEDPLHLLYHNVDESVLDVLCNHIAVFLEGISPKRLVLAGGQRPDTLTDGEVHFKLKTAAFHLHVRFPEALVEALFVNQQTGSVEAIPLNNQD